MKCGELCVTGRKTRDMNQRQDLCSGGLRCLAAPGAPQNTSHEADLRREQGNQQMAVLIRMMIENQGVVFDSTHGCMVVEPEPEPEPVPVPEPN
jgi:hypothetical protein